MGSVMLVSRKVLEFKSRQTRARSLQFPLGLTLLFCGVIAVQGGIAQSARQNNSAQDSSQAPAQSSDTNTSNNGDQGTGQNGSAQGPAQPGSYTSPVTPTSDEGFGTHASGQINNGTGPAKGFPAASNSSGKTPARSGCAPVMSTQNG